MLLVAIMSSRIEYKIKKDIASLALSAGGTLFGGYVRDSILHNYWADKFYDTPDVDTSRYNDETYIPETKNRLVIPTDIDVMIHSDKVTAFFDLLGKNQYQILKHSSSTLGYAFKEDIRLLDIKHDKVTIAPVVHPLMKTLFPQISVEVDLVHSDNYTDDMIRLDFQCNGVYITSNGDFTLNSELVFAYRNPFAKKRILDKIMSDICNMVAVKANEAMPHRVAKMLKKGWTLKGDIIQAEKYKSDGDEHCAICLDKFKGDVAIKGLCCNGRLHPKCYRKLIKNNRDSCIFCCHTLDIDSVDKEFLL